MLLINNTIFILLISTALVVCFLGLLGIFIGRKNIIFVLICVELSLISLNMLFVLFSFYLDDIIGYFFSFIILTIAASESAIGLALLIVFYRLNQSININFLSKIKG